MGRDSKQLLEDYARLLLQWNTTHSLTAAKNVSEVMVHIHDSLEPLALLEPFATCMDVGSGAGFPAIPMAIMRPESHFWLIEPLPKKASFLQVAVIELGLCNVEVCRKKVEQLEPFFPDLITSRALMKTKELLEHLRPFVTEATQVLLFKGERLEEELAGLKIQYTIEQRGTRRYLIIKGATV